MLHFNTFHNVISTKASNLHINHGLWMVVCGFVFPGSTQCYGVLGKMVKLMQGIFKLRTKPEMLLHDFTIALLKTKVPTCLFVVINKLM